MLLNLNYRWALIACVLCNLLSCYGSKLARGFNEDIDWVPYEEGLELQRETGKPLLLLIHKSWCGACKALKPKFATDREIERLSRYFIMVNCIDNEEPDGQQFRPDGAYIPRILFMHEGKVERKVINEDGPDSYKYYYPEAEHVAKSMKRANDLFGGASRQASSSDDDSEL